MAELDGRMGAEEDVLARLEAALDRISQRGAIAIPPAPSATTDAVARRLDALIAQLRGALEGGPATLEE